MYNVTSEICVFESDLGLVYVIIPQSRSNVRSIAHGMLFVYVDCLPSITGSEKKDGKKLAQVGFEPVHAFDTGWQTLSLTIAPSGQKSFPACFSGQKLLRLVFQN